MYTTYPVYYPSARWARENDEIELWRESYKINNECRDFINGNAGKAHHNEELPGFIKELTDAFGVERAMYVIARTIVGADWDRRYYNDVRSRAESFPFQDMEEAAQLRENGQDPYRTADKTAYLCSDVHPVMLNAIFRCLMKMEQEQVNLPQAEADRSSELDEGAEI